jgi:hypothetical protein
MDKTRFFQTHGRAFGISLFLAGLLTFALSRWIERGFVHGLFQGMTIALMVIAAYVLGRGLFARPDKDAEEEWWLPSQDEK